MNASAASTHVTDRRNIAFSNVDRVESIFKFDWVIFDGPTALYGLAYIQAQVGHATGVVVTSANSGENPLVRIIEEEMSFIDFSKPLSPSINRILFPVNITAAMYNISAKGVK